MAQIPFTRERLNSMGNQFQLYPILVYGIGINFIEILVEFLLFALFYVNYRRGSSMKGAGGGLSLQIGVGSLFLGLNRVSLIVFDYISPNPIFQIIATSLTAIGLLAVVLGFFRVVKIAFPQSRQFAIMTYSLFPVGIFLLFAAQVFSSVAFNTWSVILAVFFDSIIFFYFARVMAQKGVKVFRQMLLFAAGLCLAVVGSNFTANYVAELYGEFALGAKVIGHSFFLCGLFLAAIGFWTLPELRELEWRETLRHLYLIMKSGLCVFDHSFKVEQTTDSDLVAGGITGITQLIPEMTKSEEKVEVIQQKDTKILLKYGQYVNIALIAKADLHTLHAKLDTFIAEFESLYKHVLPEWNGNADIFIPTLALVEKFFT